MPNLRFARGGPHPACRAGGRAGPAFGTALLLLATAFAPAAARETGASLAAIEAALAGGDPLRADSLWKTIAPDAPELRTQRGALLAARLDAARGDWNGARTRLESWLSSPIRTGSTGEVHFWLAWTALHQQEAGRADPLLVLASADTASPRARDALEYRFALLLETGPALTDYLRGLPESPLPRNLRRAVLEKIQPDSRLYPSALWELARISRLEGRTGDFIDILQQLSSLDSPQGRRSAALLAFLQEGGAPDSAISRYENLLFQEQNGPIAEFSRARLRLFRPQTP